MNLFLPGTDSFQVTWNESILVWEKNVNNHMRFEPYNNELLESRRENYFWIFGKKFFSKIQNFWVRLWHESVPSWSEFIPIWNKYAPTWIEFIPRQDYPYCLLTQTKEILSFPWNRLHIIITHTFGRVDKKWKNKIVILSTYMYF